MKPWHRNRRPRRNRQGAGRPVLESLEKRYLLAGDLELASLTSDGGGDGSEGMVLQGASAGDQTGRTVGSAGDFNGDGFLDFFLSAPASSPNGSESGRLHVVFGRPSLAQAEFSLDALDGSNGFRIEGLASGDRLGSALSHADINGDGFDDLILSARDATRNNEVSAGEAYVVFGRAVTASATFQLSSLLPENGGDGTAGFVIRGTQGNATLGRSVASAGDVNRDGLEDVLIGAPGASPNGIREAGETYLLFGRQSTFPALMTASDLAGDFGMTIQGAAEFDYAGSAVSSAGDVNGDGFDDILLGARGRTPTGGDYSAGEAYILFGKSSFPDTYSLGSLDAQSGVQLSGSGEFAGTGSQVGGLGDINGDGFADVLVAAEQSNGGNGEFSGRAFVLFGKSSLGNVELDDLSSPHGFELIGASEDDFLGMSISGVGDVNGDGLDDLVVGAPYADPGSRAYAGQAYLLFGRESAFPDQIRPSSLDGDNGLRLNGVDAFDVSSMSVSGVGDVNGDGFDDLLIGAPYADPGGRDAAGEAYLLLGRDFTHAVDQLGDDQANELVGNGGRDNLVGAQGDDRLDGQGHRDSLSGGEGDDAFWVSDLSFLRVSGGTGMDRLVLAPIAGTLNLTSIPASRMLSIEELDLRGGATQTLQLDQASVLRLSNQTNDLRVRLSGNDELQLGNGWTDEGEQQVDGETFHVFTQGNARVLVSETTSWQNPRDRNDVNDRDGVTPLDVLLVVNHINDHPGNPNLPDSPESPPPYLDVTGDGFITALDALQVINFINQSGSGEGEETAEDRSLRFDSTPIRIAEFRDPWSQFVSTIDGLMANWPDLEDDTH